MNWWMWILVSFYFFLPGGIANMAPILTKRWRFLDVLKFPVDRGRIWKGKPVFGKNKTWRGIVAGAVFGTFVGLLQFLFQDSVGWLQLFPYSLLDALSIGFLLGLGALLGDLVESFFKRRIGKKSGSPWIPFDQIDLVVGGLVLVSMYHVVPWQIWLSLLIVMPLIHFLFNLLGYGMGLKDVWW